jgi:glycosyltransferase involved in cell wall biosynthesis
MSAASTRKILYVVNDAPFFLSHRLPLALAAKAAGYHVHVATPDSPSATAIQKHGLQFHAIPLHRSSTRIWKELASLQALMMLYRGLLPDLIHHVTIKPVLYGGLAARLTRIPAVVHAVPGLGHVFVERGLRASLLRAAVKRLYRLAFAHGNAKVILQNPDDQALLERMRVIGSGESLLIRGSGVDMQAFAPRPEPDTIPTVILAARMLWAKGVGEFVDAARLLREQQVEARFVLVGESDPGNPSAVPVWQLEQWHDSGVVEWMGTCDDMPRIFAEAHMVCLPSYREGLPKVLIEAAACGRPIVTTDTPGCREVVRHEENGLLVPPRDAVALAAALRRLILSPALRAFLGKRGREIAVAEFGLEKVVEETLAVYRELLMENSGRAAAVDG